MEGQEERKEALTVSTQRLRAHGPFLDEFLYYLNEAHLYLPLLSTGSSLVAHRVGFTNTISLMPDLPSENLYGATRTKLPGFLLGIA